MSNNNKTAYNSNSVVNEYKEKLFLFKGEKNLLNLIKERAELTSMLDIGIGTGRTTYFFSKYFKKYVGIDYASEMIKLAKSKYSINKNCRFYTLDATDMQIFDDNTFDVILFSFNGLDCVSYRERIKIVKEINRVAKPNALFCYSTHNIYNIPKLFSFRLPRNPFNLPSELRKYNKINKINKNYKELIKEDYVIIADGDIDFTVKYYYCNINFEIDVIKKLGFKINELQSLKTGEIYNINTNWEKITTPWIQIISNVEK